MEQDPINWAEVDSSDESSPEPVQSKSLEKPIKQSNPVKKSIPKTKIVNEGVEVRKKDVKIAKNAFECVELDAEDDGDDDNKNKVDKKENALSELLKVTNKKETTKPSVVLSKKEMKKKELEELENIINELGLKPTEEKLSPTKSPAKEKPQSEGEILKKKKKKEKKEEKKEESKPEKAEEQNQKESKETEPIDKEKAILAALKKKAAKEKKASGPNLESAKQEILARQAKKKNKTKKHYEDQ